MCPFLLDPLIFELHEHDYQSSKTLGYSHQYYPSLPIFSSYRAAEFMIYKFYSNYYLVVFAGPLITVPMIAENLDSWQGQSNVFSSMFHSTVHHEYIRAAEGIFSSIRSYTWSVIASFLHTEESIDLQERL
jgi:hypothetical protein